MAGSPATLYMFAPTNRNGAPSRMKSAPLRVTKPVGAETGGDTVGRGVLVGVEVGVEVGVMVGVAVAVGENVAVGTVLGVAVDVPADGFAAGTWPRPAPAKLVKSPQLSWTTKSAWNGRPGASRITSKLDATG